MRHMQERQNQLYEQSKKNVAPVFEAFVQWVIEEARRRDIKTLYFLARDGYILRQIAQALCEAKGIDIQCRYLYCSRKALRMPTYHLIGDEAYDLLFMGGYHVTVESFLERAGISEDEWDTVLAETGALQRSDIRREIAYAELGKYREALLQSHAFRAQVRENSLNSYPAAAGYLRQEGLFEQARIGVVDSGWTGSVQRSLRQLLQAGGFAGQITGFYFGMFTQPKDPADGEYLTWFFSANRGKSRKVWFCNNLFECLLSAPHGMTEGYKKENGVFVPVMSAPPDSREKQLFDANTAGVLDGAKDIILRGTEPLSVKQCAALLRCLMYRPARETAELYGRFAFCDDVTEAYHFALADAGQQKLLKNYAVLSRLMRKLRRSGSAGKMTELFWPCGTAAFLDSPLKRAWYRMNIVTWEWLKYTFK